MSTVQNFVEVLEGLKSMKTGISGTRIKKLTQMAVENVSLESQFVEETQKYLKEAQDSHKLGALYVIDSIARAYKEKANKLGETVGASSKEGTYGNALYKYNAFIQEALSLVLEVINSEQEEKVGKLLEIWRKSGTFEEQQLQPIKARYFGSSNGTSQTAPAASVQPTDPNEILRNLAALAGNNQPQQQQAPAPVQPTDPNEILKNLAALTGNNQAQQQEAPASVPVQQQQPAGLPNLAALAGSDPNAQQAALFQMLQTLQATGQMPVAAPAPAPASSGSVRQPLPPQDQQFGGARGGFPQEDRFRSRGNERGAGGSDRYSRRGRESSPGRGQDGKDAPPPGHVIGEHNDRNNPHFREKYVSFDQSIPSGSIKVLSRTLFIGGVPNYMEDQELASLLRPFAEVQSVILNKDRKIAFVKVYSRAEAESVISSFNKNGALPLRTRWGVGFGPRDCCDYQHGISIIPIQRLTDADRRWVNAAEWGGVGMEKPLTGGLVMEEPDIEIGEGVSSKAISKKMPTDGSRNGPRSTKPGEPDDIYTDPLNQSNIPSFMQGGNKANPLANLFNQQAQAAPAAVPAPAPPTGAPAGGDANAQLSNLMAFLQQQQK